MEYVEKGKAEGAVLVHGGIAGEPGGNFVAPTMFKDVEVTSVLLALCPSMLILSGSPYHLPRGSLRALRRVWQV
jgi:hypothetical protein